MSRNMKNAIIKKEKERRLSSKIYKGNIGRERWQHCARQQLVEGGERNPSKMVEERMKLKVLLVLIGSVQLAECSVGKWQVK